MATKRSTSRRTASRPAPKPPLGDVQFDEDHIPDEFFPRPDDGLAVIAGAGGRAGFIPTSLIRATPVVRELSLHVQELVDERRKLDHQIEQHVFDMRSLGASWGIIGWSVGTTSDAALKRWGTDDNGDKR